MSDWSAGYVADIDYTFGYYQELNPARMKLAFLNAGLAFPDVKTACELGFGQGVSANVHAAGTVTRWYGTDFNPSQASFAREMADAAGANAMLTDESFAEFAARTDLPDFDFIGLHGIWSWISDENRSIIVEFIRRKLKVGGVVYISYNTLPGWASFAPMRHLMTQHAEILGAEGKGIVSRIDGAVEFAEKMLSIDSKYGKANPTVAERLKRLKEQNRHYLAHEYFNKDWHPMHFGTMLESLERGKLQYGCSAHVLDHIDALNLTEEQQNFLKEIPDRNFRESVRDFITNQQFRRDYWIKGVRKLTKQEQADGLRKLRVILVTSRKDIKYKVPGVLGDADMHANVYDPLLDIIADHKARTIHELETVLKEKSIGFYQLISAIVVLAGMGHLDLAQDEKIVATAAKQTTRLNRYIREKTIGGNDINYQVSPVTGGAVNINRIHQMFAQLYENGEKDTAIWTNNVWQHLQSQNQKLLKEGKLLQTEEENLAELASQATEFLNYRIPVLKALKIV